MITGVKPQSTSNIDFKLLRGTHRALVHALHVLLQVRFLSELLFAERAAKRTHVLVRQQVLLEGAVLEERSIAVILRARQLFTELVDSLLVACAVDATLEGGRAEATAMFSQLRMNDDMRRQVRLLTETFPANLTTKLPAVFYRKKINNSSIKL